VAEPPPGPQALVLLANLGLRRRPSGATVAHADPILPDAATATVQLADLIGDRPVAAADLPDLRRLQRAAVAAADALLAGGPLDCAGLNALATGSRAHVELSVDGGLAPRRRLVWTDGSLAAGLARRLVEELSTIEPARLRRCAAHPCRLLFYDTTRSRTRRWHADDPCGWRQRSARRGMPR
jgi:hypothetical protein